ncbi:MAG: TonB-dependent receptor plug domain-containing protein [Bacteroidetes bacterium]|nr:TonB-dependent receptor plug domain-containing protein [Bacteroidota bacterium]
MKRILFPVIGVLAILQSFSQQDSTKKKDSFLLLEPVEVTAVRAGEKAPFTKTNLSKKEIEKINVGQDLPFILNQTPSVIVNSDAGNGVGYTGIRIRGTDATRINVTLNGIPYNDAESQGTFFVDLPDFTSSVNTIQVQRGVGTSSNGAGAFGATINVSTNEVNKDHYAEFNNSYGSFNTWKNTIKAGTGLINDHFTADIRLSNITSDGYIDRASTDLKSFYFSTAYISDKTSLRFNVFSGKEKTYQAWNGVPESLLKTDRTYNSSGTEKPGTPYDNETDNYIQSHYQLFFNQQLSKNLSFNTAVFLTRGKGYYEEYRAEQDYASYGQPYPIYGNDTIITTDLIRRLWLDNYFYGDVFSFQYKTDKSQFILGGGWTRYDGKHYGDIIWAQNGSTGPDVRWYNLKAKKTDANIYFKQQTQLAGYWNFFYDLQFRHVQYNIDGFKDNPALVIHSAYNFFNPKVGISYNQNGWNGYLSYSRAAKEPNRDDYEANQSQQPVAEKLNDLELGFGRREKNYSWNAVLYYMGYKDQLVVTGKINDVGAYTRTNIPKSYRAGVELEGAISITKWLKASGNLSLSRNKVVDFTEYVDDYDNGGQKSYDHKSADIALSPGVIGGATISFIPVKNLEIGLLSKYVSKQYLDNTENESRKLNAYYTQDARIIYTLSKAVLKEANLFFQVNNIFNRKYEPNGYTYSYIYAGSLTTENFYFPMAGTNVMAGINIKL